MFWGLIMEPKRRYTQQVKKAFHISMASLDISTSSDEPAQVICGFEGRNYLLCTLKKPDMLQCPLDLNFNVGSEVSFAANGKCHVHLTGYLTDEFLDLPEEEEEAEDEQEIEEPPKSKKRSKRSLENGPPTKKAKGAQVSSSQKENEDSGSDSDLDVNALLGETLDESDDDDSVILEGEEEDVEEEEDEDEDEEEEDADSSLSEAESDENETQEIPKPKMNGVSKEQEKAGQKQKKDKRKKGNQQEQNKSPKSGQKKEGNEGKIAAKQSQTPKKRTLQGGITVEDIREGQGAPAKNGKFVTVYYEGRLKQNNKLFDSTTKGAGFSFRLGHGEVIKGWDIAVAGMKPGGKRRIVCPPSMAYGQKGSPPAIPPNSTLIFEVEVKKIN